MATSRRSGWPSRRPHWNKWKSRKMGGPRTGETFFYPERPSPSPFPPCRPGMNLAFASDGHIKVKAVPERQRRLVLAPLPRRNYFDASFLFVGVGRVERPCEVLRAGVTGWRLMSATRRSRVAETTAAGDGSAGSVCADDTDIRTQHSGKAQTHRTAKPSLTMGFGFRRALCPSFLKRCG